ncbi:hypothetical protein K435DRAFT_965285 [Dendrothele bispora CBS 962.96]|uniref:DUF6533 domain-containing protein n=1 Tax=Dendrothele bispora (strain CBS 962.96) TaxID=1314807 RepID=A0A4S8M657_DENBC|nr:hypothetical protein K435DRAFT_965285 [Dendrothele bispora CBS 962.96]
MDSSLGSDASSIRAQREEGYLHLCAIVILYWDHIITFPSEVEFVWKHPISKGSILFFLNRYFSSLGNIVVTYGLFSSNLSPSRCNHLHLFREILLVITQLIVCVLLTLRTWALYACSRRVLIFIMCCVLTVAAMACLVIFYGHRSQPTVTSIGCHAQSKINSATSTSLRVHTAMSPEHWLPPLGVAAAWETLFLYDTVVFVMTLLKAYQVRGLLLGRMSLLYLVLRDDAIYFAVMALANLVNILTFYLCEPYMKGGVSSLASAISVTLMSRLMLNLHKEAGVDPCSTNYSTCEFAVRTGSGEPDILFVDSSVRSEDREGCQGVGTDVKSEENRS